MARILIVDDERGIRRTLAEFLRGDGHEVREAADADDALRQLDEAGFDLVVTDIILPRVTGVELLRRIHAAAPDVQVVMMTGEPTVETASESLRAGAADYLFKPITKAAILRVVANAVRLKTLYDTRRQLEAEKRAYQEDLERLVDERTQQLRAQAELLDLAQDAISVRDMNGCVRYWNKGCERATGWTAAEALGRPVSGLVKPNPDDLDQAMRRLLRDGHWTGELTVAMKDGQRLTIMSRWTLVRDEQGQPKSVLAIDTDITGQKKLEAQFLRAQRMESLGRLASGIAHDLNNILAPILMGASLLRQSLTREEAGPLIETIGASAQRGSDVVKQLLTFARGTEGQRIPVPPSRLIREMAGIVQETFPKSLVLRTRFPKELWTIMGDPTQLHQVLLNLCVNARDAMPESGTLTIFAENLTLDGGRADLPPEAKPGWYVVLGVSDTGLGMPADILDKIFDPFFTTKGPEMGTGLGLATVQGIVKSHEGFIQVESAVGQGSHFRVYLPARPVADKAPTATPGEELPRGGGELVLVVDDELNVRQITGKILEKYGYRIITASEGSAALALYAQYQAEIQVVLTDMMMPGMDGAATIRALRGISPQLKIIAVSGADSKPQPAEITNLTVQAYLQKPFTAQTLLVTLARVVRGGPTS